MPSRFRVREKICKAMQGLSEQIKEHPRSSFGFRHNAQQNFAAWHRAQEKKKVIRNLTVMAVSMIMVGLTWYFKDSMYSYVLIDQPCRYILSLLRWFINHFLNKRSQWSFDCFCRSEGGDPPSSYELDCYPYSFSPLLLFSQSSYFDKGHSNYNAVARFFKPVLGKVAKVGSHEPILFR